MIRPPLLAMIITILAPSIHADAQEPLNSVALLDAKIHAIECYKIVTPNATYYLDKRGAGIASLVDREGNDWISFEPRSGSKAKGEYRGFPNAVFREAGNYFHPTNSSTDPCTTKIIEQTANRIIISAVSQNGKWAAEYTFTTNECVFTMTQKPAGHKYWVLYEGAPGGQFDDTDWWLTSTDRAPHPLTENRSGDLERSGTNEEWIAFGDNKASQALVLRHMADDRHPDHFYQMNHQMTVFGFGRNGMKKFLNSVPASFSISFVDTKTLLNTNRRIEPAADFAKPDANSITRSELAQIALTGKGNADAGKRIFNSDRAKCATCHQVNRAGELIGPNLSNVGGKFDRAHLIDSLLYPSRQITYGYETTTILTEDGRTVSGIIKEREATNITLANADNQRFRIPVDSIESSRTSVTSLMPTGIADLLSVKEFVDLLSYLESLGNRSSKFGGSIAGPISLPDGFAVETVATGLSGAVALDVAPDGRIFVCEQGGTLVIIDREPPLDQNKRSRELMPPDRTTHDSTTPKAGAWFAKTVLSIPVECKWERGLIGVTIPPDFPTAPFIYVVYVTDTPITHHRISRFTLEGDTIAPSSEIVLFEGDDQSKFGGNVPAGHQGGGIHFGPDGKLYVGIGEQTAGKPAQSLSALQGKILRLNPDGSIPTDNPFLKQTAGKYQAIWAMGFRNPFTLAFNQNGELFINDVGGKHEEINRGIAGANYGWPEADHGPTDRPGFTGPIHSYPQSCINGGDFCEIERWPERFQGRYFFADFNQGWVKTIAPQSTNKSMDFLSGVRRPVDLRFGPDGSLFILLRNAWVVDKRFENGTGTLLRIFPTTL